MRVSPSRFGRRRLLLPCCGVLLAATSALVITLSAGCAGERGEDDSAPALIANPYGVYSPGTLDEVPTSAGALMIERLGVDSYGAFQDFSIALVDELGIGWVRADFLYTGWGFQEPDDYLQKLRGRGIEVVGCLRPINDFVPADLSGFEASTRTLVDAYPWITVWQVGNEPNVSVANPDDYPRLLLAGSRAVRSECPECRVMLAGVAANYPAEQRAIWAYGRTLAQIAHAGPREKPFDIFDMHYYGRAYSDRDMLAAATDYRRLLDDNGFGDARMWLTETATTTGPLQHPPPDMPAQSEDEQAAELVRRLVTALGIGMERVSWARPYENYRYGDLDGGYYDNAGLVYNGIGWEELDGVPAGTRKKSFYAYRNLIDMTSGYSTVAPLSPGVYRFAWEEGRELFVLWEAVAGEPAQIPPGLNGQVRVTDMLGNSHVLDASSLGVGAEPVFVEAR